MVNVGKKLFWKVYAEILENDFPKKITKQRYCKIFYI